jgi:GTP-binding protein EngB required for normal cell division
MNDNHARHLLVTFRYIENLLSEAEHLLATAGSSSPLAEHTQDSSPLQRKVIHDYIQRVHEAMRRAMTDLNLPKPKPVCGALWAAQNHINFASIAVAEIEPKRMRGYGALDESDIKAIDSVAAELNAAIEQLNAYLAKGSDSDLQARLEKLEQTRDEVRPLRELERVITAHGLIEFRTPVALLLNRLEHPTFEIGLFGRVSSGKSSLLNHLLGAEVLPVGVTPVTAIPTRVQFGPKQRATIKFAQSQSVVVELSQLPEFSTEQQNPANAKHVAGILVEVPSERLREGVSFVDTPGLGSLATSGAAETLAYLPRCDLGVVLVDAASTLTHEDLVVVQALYQSGARAMLLVSKADLLRPADRQQTIAYAQQKLTSELGIQASVHPVSVVGSDVALCEAWFENELKPVLNTHREQLSASLKRKIGGLREALIKTFEARLQGSADQGATPSQPSSVEAITALRKTDGLFESTERAAEELIEQIPALSEAIIDAAAEDLAVIWRTRGTEQGEAAALISSARQRVVHSQSTRIVELLNEFRQQLEQILVQSHRALTTNADGDDPLPKPAGLPVHDGASILGQLELPPRPWMHFGGTTLLRHQARGKLEKQLDSLLPEFLNDYRRQVREWTHQQLIELRAAFHARSAPLRLQLEASAATKTRETDHASVASDLSRLRAWEF